MKRPALHQKSIFSTSSGTLLPQISLTFADTFWGHMHYLSSHCNTSFNAACALSCQHQVTSSNCFHRTSNTTGLHTKCVTWRLFVCSCIEWEKKKTWDLNSRRKKQILCSWIFMPANKLITVDGLTLGHSGCQTVCGRQDLPAGSSGMGCACSS